MKSWEEGRRVLEPVIIISDILQLSLRKLLFFQVFVSVRQFVRVDRMAGVMVFVEIL